MNDTLSSEDRRHVRTSLIASLAVVFTLLLGTVRVGRRESAVRRAASRRRSPPPRRPPARGGHRRVERRCGLRLCGGVRGADGAPARSARRQDLRRVRLRLAALEREDARDERLHGRGKRQEKLAGRVEDHLLRRAGREELAASGRRRISYVIASFAVSGGARRGGHVEPVVEARGPLQVHRHLRDRNLVAVRERVGRREAERRAERVARDLEVQDVVPVPDDAVRVDFGEADLERDGEDARRSWRRQDRREDVAAGAERVHEDGAEPGRPRAARPRRGRAGSRRSRGSRRARP